MVDRDFLYLEDSQNDSDDPYGDRLQLTLDPVEPIPLGAPLSVQATLRLDGQRVPVAELPEDPLNSHQRPGTAIAAAVVIEDVDQDLDRLRTFEIRQTTAETLGGHVELDLEAGSYTVRLVTRMAATPPTQRRYVVRTAKSVFTIGEPVPQDGLDTIWLVELLGPRQGHRSVRANLRHFTPGGQQALIREVFLHGAERLPPKYPFEKRAISIAPDSEESLFILSAQDDGRSRLFQAESDGSFAGPEAFDFDSQIFCHSTSVESWVWDGGRIGRYFGGALVTAFDRYTPVFALAGVQDSTFWTICGTRGQSGAGSVYLRRVDENGEEIAETRSVIQADVNTGAILNVMADGGVTAWGNYRGQGPHVVRIGAQGNVITVSDSFPSNVLDVSVNPYSGEALVVHARNGRHVELVRLNPALSTVETLTPADDRLGGQFEQLRSAAISAPPAGQRIWISGQRKERQPSGTLLDRGAVGYLESDGTFNLVQGGMETRTLLRALW